MTFLVILIVILSVLVKEDVSSIVLILNLSFWLSIGGNSLGPIDDLLMSVDGRVHLLITWW